MSCPHRVIRRAIGTGCRLPEQALPAQMAAVAPDAGVAPNTGTW
jgi:hypothetical protein